MHTCICKLLLLSVCKHVWCLQVDYDGRTAVHMACTEGRFKVIECLLKLGANLNVKDRWGQTPMTIAINAKQHLIITVLSAAKARLDMESPELELCTAAGAGDMVQVKRLVEFGVDPTIGDYDKRTALHVSAAEGHEKIVEFLLFSQADPNCKDRWGGTPLQDALSGQHLSTAHVLKGKGAQVPNDFGAEAVCSASGNGDVPRLRTLHSFGQSLDVGDYDDRYALHLACAEGRVMAVSFLLGISSDPNILDRWRGSPMDDCVRGGTLYHCYCAKLLQGWGGELGTFQGSKQGEVFLAELEKIDIKAVRQVIRKLIDQGLDTNYAERMSEEELKVVMSATAKHMPLVKTLHRNTTMITKEVVHFRTVVQTFVGQIREHVEEVLGNLLKGSRRVPEFEASIMDDVKPAARRPKSARLSKPPTRQEQHRQLDTFSGVHQNENSRVVDSLFIESPIHTHEVVAPPRRMLKWKNKVDDSADLLSGTTIAKLAKPSAKKHQKSFAMKTDLTSADILKRNNLRTDALIKTLFDSTVPPPVIRDCFRMLKKSDKKEYAWITDLNEGALDSDEEMLLHEEIDGIDINQAVSDAKHEGWWEKHGAKLFNQLALQIVHVEGVYTLLRQILCASLSEEMRPDADPFLSMENVARTLVAMHAHSKKVDLDKILAEVHDSVRGFRLLMTPKERRSRNLEQISGKVRFSDLVSASSMFRQAILAMGVDVTLCTLMRSKFNDIFTEEQCRKLVVGARRDRKKEGESMHDNNAAADHRFLTLVIKGEVLVIRTLDDVEIGRGKCTVSCHFGAHKSHFLPQDIPESEKETPVKEGGNGINNCLIKAAATCDILRIPLSNLSQVLPELQPKKSNFFLDLLLEKIAVSVENMEKFNTVCTESISNDMFNFAKEQEKEEDWELPPSKRKFYNAVPELVRQDIQEVLNSIHLLWMHLSRGAHTCPKGTVSLIKEFLGESGSQCFDNVFSPMEQATSPNTFTPEAFWFCWINFLSTSIVHETAEAAGSLHVDEEARELLELENASSGTYKGALNITIKGAEKL